jgi:hypothetical protein
VGCCRPSALQPQRQEHHETSRMTDLIAHQDDDHFILNLHALHNATLIHKILPCHLTVPKPLYEDRQARHFEIAAELWVSQAEKRARSAAKAKATKAAKKAKNHTMQGSINEERDPDMEGSGCEEMGSDDSEGGVQPQGSNKQRRRAQ